MARDRNVTVALSNGNVHGEGMRYYLVIVIILVILCLVTPIAEGDLKVSAGAGNVNMFQLHVRDNLTYSSSIMTIGKTEMVVETNSSTVLTKIK